MANTKKKNENEEVMNQETIVEKDSKDLLIERLQKQMQEMQQAFITLQSKSNQVQSSDENSTLIEIGTRLINGVSIFSPRKEVQKEIPFDKNIELDKYELDMLLKSNYIKDWLEKDVLFFTDNKIYEEKRIKKQFDLSDEYLIKMILKKSTEQVMDEISIITRNYKDDPMIHCIFYRIVELCSNGQLSTMPYETRKAIEQAFNFKIDDAQMLFRGFRNVK